MNQLFTANLNNEVVAFATSLEDFVNVIHELLPNTQKYEISDFIKKFEENSVWPFSTNYDENYNFQEVY